MTSNKTAICALTVLLFGSAAQAYQPGEVFKLDLNSAALSATPLGPPAQFEPKVKTAPPQDKAEEAVKPFAATPVARARRVTKATHVAAKPRARIARQHRNPLDANASDTRLQVWPCRSGGICNWRK
ncbi:MAG: hypothetical protein JWQ94_2088 [Tardiphaga sp.]|nr:hypothetical protein [Tardiphaga sp.]